MSLILEFAQLQVTDPIAESTRENVPDGFAGQLQELYVKEKFRVPMLKSEHPARSVTFSGWFLLRKALLIFGPNSYDFCRPISTNLS